MILSLRQLESLIDNSYVDRRGQNLIGNCPFCGEPEFAVSIYKEHNPFNCLRKKSCGQQGWIYKILKHLNRRSEFLSDYQIDIQERLHIQMEATKEAELDLEMPEIKPPMGWKRIYDDPYLRERGFTDAQFKKYEVGRSRLNKDYVTFLVRREGKLVASIGRSDRPKAEIDTYNKKQKEKGSKLVFLRYDNSGSDFSKTLFGIDEVIQDITETVILVEGIFSKTKTDVNLGLDDGEGCDWLKCCATFGAKFSDEQSELLKRKGVKTLIFWFEADVLAKIKPIVSKAAEHFIVKVNYLDGFDPADIGKEEAFGLLERSKNWLDFNTSYLSIKLQ